MQKLIPALIKARSEFGAIQKDKTNPHYKNRYATLDAVLEAITPALCSHGLAVLQTTAIQDGKTVLQTHLYHESGESLCSVYPLPDQLDPQKLGAALTYARRYALCAMLSVTADEDDDGSSASSAVKSASAKPVQTQPRPGSPGANARVKAVRESLGIEGATVANYIKTIYKVAQPDQMQPTDVSELITWMAVNWAERQNLNAVRARNSYLKHVPTLIQKGQSEVSAIESWMEYIEEQIQSAKEEGEPT